jgi:hypothetical protein
VVSLASVQLEEGENANPFAEESYGKTLEKCQRFYETGETTMVAVSDGVDFSSAGFKVVQMKRTKRKSPNIRIDIVSTVGAIAVPNDLAVRLTDERKFVVDFGFAGSQQGVRKIKAKWIADSELPLYNNLQIDGQETGRITDICDDETACPLAEECKVDTDSPCNVFATTTTVDIERPTDTFKLFFSAIPSKDMDAEFAAELGTMWGGLCIYLGEGAVTRWPLNNGDPRNEYWIMVTGPTVDALGRPCDPLGPTATDGTGGVWQAGQPWSAADSAMNHSFRGRWGQTIQEASNFSDARTVSDYTITSLNFEHKVDEVFPAWNWSINGNNYTDWQQRGCTSAANCPDAVRIDPLLEESKDYIYHRVSGTSGENIKVTYNTMVQNLLHVLNYSKTAPVQDFGFSGRPTGFYGFPRLDLWGLPITRNAAGSPQGVGYDALTSAQREALKDFYFARYEPILRASDNLQPSLYPLYSYRSLGDGSVGNVNNNDPNAPYYSPYFKKTPWGGAAQIQTNWDQNGRDRIELCKRTGNPVYPTITTMLWGAGSTIGMGSEYNGWHFTTMCNPSCSGTGVAATSPSGVVGNCYESWRCYDLALSVEDFIDSQIKPLIDTGSEGAIIWWSPVHMTAQAPYPTQEDGHWWTYYTRTNPNITQFDINAFPTSITGPSNNRINRDTNADGTAVPEGSRVARWWFMIDQYAFNMRQEIARLGLESDPDISAWISLYPNLPAGQSSSFAVSGRIFAPARQQYYNVRYAYHQFFINTFFDGADPANANDSRLGNPFGTAMAGVGLGKGWNSPAVQRFLKVAWSKHLLHYANAAKQYIETTTYADDWNVVTAFGGQVAFDAMLNEMRDDPSGWQPDLGAM